MTRKDAEKHLAHLAKRRERYAARKEARTPRTPEQLPLFAPPTRPVTNAAQQAEIDREVRNLGKRRSREILNRLEANDRLIDRLAKYDPREFVSDPASLYCDSDEWIQRRELEWLAEEV